MPALTLVSPEAQLRGAWERARGASTPCKTDERKEAWYSDRRGLAQQLDEKHAVAGCRTCSHRLLCAAWAFEMEEYWTWGGFTALQRRRLADEAPHLIGDIDMIVKGLLRLHDPRGKLKPGKTTEVDQEYGEMLVRRGYAVDVTPAELVQAGQEVLAEADDLLAHPPRHSALPVAPAEFVTAPEDDLAAAALEDEPVED